MHNADKRTHTHTHTHLYIPHSSTPTHSCMWQCPLVGPCGNSNTKRSHVALTLIYKHSSFICHIGCLPLAIFSLSISSSLSRLLESTSRTSSHVHRKTKRNPQLFASLFAGLPILASLPDCVLLPQAKSDWAKSGAARCSYEP